MMYGILFEFSRKSAMKPLLVHFAFLFKNATTDVRKLYQGFPRSWSLTCACGMA